MTMMAPAMVMTASVLVLEGQCRCITLNTPATPMTSTGKCVSSPWVPKNAAAKRARKIQVSVYHVGGGGVKSSSSLASAGRLAIGGGGVETCGSDATRI